MSRVENRENLRLRRLAFRRYSAHLSDEEATELGRAIAERRRAVGNRIRRLLSTVDVGGAARRLGDRWGEAAPRVARAVPKFAEVAPNWVESPVVRWIGAKRWHLAGLAALACALFTGVMGMLSGGFVLGWSLLTLTLIFGSLAFLVRADA
jgi:hypothetical protein